MAKGKKVNLARSNKAKKEKAETKEIKETKEMKEAKGTKGNRRVKVASFRDKVAACLLKRMDVFEHDLKRAAVQEVRQKRKFCSFDSIAFQKYHLALMDQEDTGKKDTLLLRYELEAVYTTGEEAKGQAYEYEDNTSPEDAELYADEIYFEEPDFYDDFDPDDLDDDFFAIGDEDLLEELEEDEEGEEDTEGGENEEAQAGDSEGAPIGENADKLEAAGADEAKAEGADNSQVEGKETAEAEGQEPYEKKVCRIEFVVLVRTFHDIKGDPFLLKVIELAGEKENIPFPAQAGSLTQFVKMVDQILQEFHLSDRALKSIREFASFKYHTMIRKSKHPEAFKTYYNLLIQGEDMDNVDRFVSVFDDLFGLQGEDKMVKTELESLDWFDNNRKDYDKSAEDFQDKKVIYIKNCQERPYINEDAGTGSEKILSEKRAKLYVDFWNFIARYTKENPFATIIISMKDYVYANSFSSDNELNHRIFGHRLLVPEMSMEQVIDICLDEFRFSSIELTPDFEEEFVNYVRTIYRTADLKGEKFAKDVINRVYSYYFRGAGGKKPLTVKCIPPYSKDIRSADDVLNRLNKMVGLKRVKETFQTIYKKQIADPESARKEGHHMMFYGNPGTGKTTVARLAADLLCQSGFLKTNKYVEVTVGDIVSAYKSNTANKIRRKIQEAMDGVLFIDEAYGLANGNEHNAEALNVLIQEMLNYQNRLVVILAGYEDKMMELLKSNVGLSSRIAHQVHFDDYTVAELMEIFTLQCREIGFSLDPSAEHVLEECLNMRRLQDFYGNGRDVANLIGELQGKWSEEYYDIVKKNGNMGVDLPKVFNERHFENVMPPKNDISIDALVGLETVKKQLEKFKKQVTYIHSLREMGMKNLPESFMHMLFVGNPGTGKTTVAKMIANDLYSLGVLKTNRLVVAERKDIISPYRGESSKQIHELIGKAIGGVMLIDEAYSLADAGAGGREAMEVLLTAMVDHKEDTIFIFAGYPTEMRRFLEINPGIPSRIGFTFAFEDYKTEELLEIFEKKMSESGFVVSKDALPKVREIMEYFREMPRFGNGRFVEKVIAQIISNRANRECNKQNYNQIEICDIPEIGEMIETNSTGLRLLDPKKISEGDRLRTAYHELGHAIAVYEFDPMMELERISVVNRAFSLGRVSIKRSFRNRTEDELKNEIIISLAGRSSERVFFGNCDEGCVSDYEYAKEIADAMINRYGMCEIGLTTVSDLVRQGDRDATKLIQKYQRCMESIAQDLVVGREFTGEEFKKRVNDFMNK